MRPTLSLGRVIIFTRDIAGMTNFYRDVIGLPVAHEEAGWCELDAGGPTIALHYWDGEAPEGPIKIVFRTSDVASDRDQLIARGAPMGPIVAFGGFDLCDGTDPDGNAFQLSSRP